MAGFNKRCAFLLLLYLVKGCATWAVIESADHEQGDAEYDQRPEFDIVDAVALDVSLGKIMVDEVKDKMFSPRDINKLETDEFNCADGKQKICSASSGCSCE